MNHLVNRICGVLLWAALPVLCFSCAFLEELDEPVRRAPVRAGGSIHGVLLDPEGLRLGGARVGAYLLHGAEEVAAKPQAQMMTDDVGRFNLDGLDPGNYIVRVDAPPYLPLEREVRLKSSVPWASLTLRLVAGYHLEGRVLRDGRDPMANVQLAWICGAPESGSVPLTTRSDAQGRYQVVLPHGHCELQVSDPRIVSHRVRFSDFPEYRMAVDIWAPAGAPLEVFAQTPRGRRIEGASFEWQCTLERAEAMEQNAIPPTVEGREYYRDWTSTREGQSDRYGYLKLEHFPDAPWRCALEARSPTGTTYTFPPMSAADSPLEASLCTFGELIGRLEDAQTGEPVREARLELWDDPAQGLALQVEETGRFMVNRERLGAWFGPPRAGQVMGFAIEAPGHVRTPVAVTLDRTNKDICGDIELGRISLVAGRELVVQLQPVPGRGLGDVQGVERIVRQAGRSAERSIAGQPRGQGRYALGRVLPGEHLLRITLQDDKAVSTTVWLEAEAPPGAIAVAIPAPPREWNLSGYVRQASGMRVPVAGVWLQDEAGMVLERQIADGRGVFRFAAIPAGTWRVGCTLEPLPAQDAALMSEADWDTVRRHVGELQAVYGDTRDAVCGPPLAEERPTRDFCITVGEPLSEAPPLIERFVPKTRRAPRRYNGKLEGNRICYADVERGEYLIAGRPWRVPEDVDQTFTLPQGEVRVALPEGYECTPTGCLVLFPGFARRAPEDWRAAGLDRECRIEGGEIVARDLAGGPRRILCGQLQTREFNVYEGRRQRETFPQPDDVRINVSAVDALTGHELTPRLRMIWRQAEAEPARSYVLQGRVNGRYRIAYAGVYEVSFQVDGYASVESRMTVRPGKTLDLKLRFKPGVAVDLIAVDREGRRLEGVRVEAWDGSMQPLLRLAADQDALLPGYQSLDRRTDASGVLRLESLPPGQTITLRLSQPGRLPVQRKLLVAPTRTTPVRIEMPRLLQSSAR